MGEALLNPPSVPLITIYLGQYVFVSDFVVQSDSESLSVRFLGRFEDLFCFDNLFPVADFSTSAWLPAEGRAP
jgi:hypothetical protein